MTKADIQFQIDQLRKDKIIYAIESTATSMSMFLVALAAPEFLFNVTAEPHRKVYAFVLVVGLGYWLYMGIGNLFRLKKIKQLEKKLYESQ